MAVSLPVLNNYFKTWLQSQVRIDEWTLDMPSNLVTKLANREYAANTAVQFPPIKLEFEPSATGLFARAEFHFRIQYRFSKTLEYHQVPINACCAILNNLYFKAVNNPSDINRSIMSIKTPTDGIDVFISEPEDQGLDWIVTLNPQFFVEFRPELADDSDLNPTDPNPPRYPITQFAIAIYRSDLGKPNPDQPSSYDLDRRYELEVLNGQIS